MHRSLHILEIVTMISHEIDHKTLSSFARACRMFRDPALDVLWMHQNTLMNLLRCMPEGIWDESDEEGDWTLHRPVLPADWERPLFYACRVKSFHYDDRFRSPCFPTSPDFLESLRLCFSGPHIFPNIEKLSWYSYHESTFPHVRLFFRTSAREPGLVGSSVDCASVPLTGHCGGVPLIDRCRSRMLIRAGWTEERLNARSGVAPTRLAVPPLSRQRRRGTHRTASQLDLPDTGKSKRPCSVPRIFFFQRHSFPSSLLLEYYGE
ncbi:hypothetical protein B0H14DRAFT_187607 [Mycena olivaceomarginata]|nr:hypothetical protein B0H14DRAFT_187607 [Mycena olivaceomarginata]